MLDFEVQRATRRCAATSREFQPGEVYYSLLEEEGGHVVRRDYSAAAWPGPSDQAIGWWRATLPEAHSAGPKMAPNDIALELFDHWRNQPGREDATYILALLLVRKRVFRLNDVMSETGSSSSDELHLLCPARATEYTVRCWEVSDQRAQEIQTELLHLLYADSP